MPSFLKAKPEEGGNVLKTWQRLQNQLRGVTNLKSDYITPEPEAMASLLSTGEETLGDLVPSMGKIVFQYLIDYSYNPSWADPLNLLRCILLGCRDEPLIN